MGETAAARGSGLRRRVREVDGGALSARFPLDRWRKLLGAGRKLRLVMESPDMMPAVQPGDVLHFEEARLMGLRKGDLVLVHIEGCCRLRRVRRRNVARGGENFDVDADALDEPPRTVGFEDILAHVVAIDREGETLGPRGGSPRSARVRRRLRERLWDLWYGLLLRFGR